MRKVLAICVLLVATTVGSPPASADTEPPTLRIGNQRVTGVSPGFFAANHRYAHNGYRSWNPETNQPYRRVVSSLKRLGVRTLRFPGGSVSNMYDWKRSIGPANERKCQIDARWGHGGSSGEYGIDEHMKLSRMVKSRTLITVPFITSTPTEAADLVEYANARVGENPNGGKDWALERLANQRRLNEPTGPYNIKRWTVGNEPYLMNQRFWMAEKDSVAVRQYLHGGSTRFTDQLVGRGCTRSEDTSQGTGRPDQGFRVLYPPVKAGTQTITVGGDNWTEVARLSKEHRGRRVYTLDDTSGRIQFGDGSTGARPRRGQPVRASYTSVHQGYLAYARAMHRVDPRIDVCSEWGQPRFIRAARNHRYDCLAAHAYSFLFNYQWRSARDGHDLQMAAEERRMSYINDLKRRLRRIARGNPYLAVTEMGHLAEEQPKFPDWASSASDGLYMVSQFARMAKAGIPVVVGGAVIAAGKRGWLAGYRDFRLTGPARFMTVMRPVLAGSVIASRLKHNRSRSTSHGDGHYDALYALVTKRRGRLSILLINRDPKNNLTVKVSNPHGQYRRRAKLSRTATRSFTDTSVRLVNRAINVGSGNAFRVRVPAHSVTRVTLRRT